MLLFVHQGQGCPDSWSGRSASPSHCHPAPRSSAARHWRGGWSHTWQQCYHTEFPSLTRAHLPHKSYLFITVNSQAGDLPNNQMIGKDMFENYESDVSKLTLLTWQCIITDCLSSPLSWAENDFPAERRWLDNDAWCTVSMKCCI